MAAKLPKRLANPQEGGEWAGKSLNRLMSASHNLVDYAQDVPRLTEAYLAKRRYELGRIRTASRTHSGERWEEIASKHFGEIANLQKEPMYPVARIPLEVSKIQGRTTGLVDKAEDMLYPSIAKIERKALSEIFGGKKYRKAVRAGHWKPELPDPQYFKQALRKIGRDEKLLKAYKKRAAEFKAEMQKLPTDMRTEVAGYPKTVPLLIKDADRIEKHIKTAERQLSDAKGFMREELMLRRGIRKRILSAAFALAERAKKSHQFTKAIAKMRR